jgi:ankyrin repeat protein
LLLSFLLNNVFTQPPRDQLFSFLNGKRDVPLTPLENDSIRKIIQEHPETCRETYPFESYPGVDSTVPLSRLCLRLATSDVIELAYNAHPPAIHDEDRHGWLPLHYACGRKASLEVVQFLVERNPAALEAADKYGFLPLHYACTAQASLEVVQFLVEKNPAALEAVDKFGELPFDIACDDNTSLELLRVLVQRTPATCGSVFGGIEPLCFQTGMIIALGMAGRRPMIYTGTGGRPARN